MFLTNLKRIIKVGFISFWRNGLVSIAAVLTMTVTLFVIGSLYIGTSFLNSSLQSVKDKVDISVSFKVDAPEDDIQSLKNEIALLNEVKNVSLSSREQELADFKERHKDNAVLLQSLEEVENPFGARLNISASDPAQYESIARFLNNKNDPALGGNVIIDQISYKKNIVDKLIKLIDTSRELALVISIALIILSVIVTFNTVALTIYIAREEISVMRLVGAGIGYVRGPFIVEGVISGLIASLVSFLLLYPAAIWVRSLSAGVYGGIDMVSIYFSNFVQIFFLLLVCGIGLGAIASLWATRKYVKI